MSTNKSLNYLDNQNTPPTTAEEVLDEDNFFTGAIFDILNDVKNNNQQSNAIAEETNATQYQRDQHLLENRFWCSSECNSRKSDSNSANKTKNNKVLDHPKHIQRKQYSSKRTMNFRCVQYCSKNVPCYLS